MLRLLIAALAGFAATAVVGATVAWLLVTIAGGNPVIVFVAAGAGFSAGAFAAVRVLRWHDRRELASARDRAPPAAAGPIAGLEPWPTKVPVATPGEAAPDAVPEAPSPVETGAPPEDVDEGDDEARLRRQVRAELMKDAPAKTPGWGTGLVLLVLFAVVMGVDSVNQVVILIAVLLLHELGHLAAMVAFGYRDVRVFFIPFFGAVTVGRAHEVAVWKRVIVSLAGPMPGLVIAGAAFGFVALSKGSVRDFFQTMLLINAFNLLPIGSLDGGKVVSDLLFSRNRWVEIGFCVLSALALIGIGLSLKLWILVIFAVFELLRVPYLLRVQGVVGGFRAHLSERRPVRPHDIDDGDLRVLIPLVRPLVGPQTVNAPQGYATQIRGMLEMVSTSTAGVGATVGLLFLYGAGCLWTLVSLVLWAASAQ